MERHHRSSRSKEREKVNDHGRHHRHHQRPRRVHEQNSEPRKKHFRHGATSKDHAANVPPRPLCGKDEYVRNWLVQTKDEVHPQGVGQQGSRNQPDYAAHRANSIRSFREHKHSTINVEPIQPRLKRRRHSSSDSSLLEPTVRPKAPGPYSEYGEQEQGRTRKGEGVIDHLHKKRKRVSSNTEASIRSPAHENTQHETFERRRRHKTHEDRYEPSKKGRESKEDVVVKTRRSRREKRGDRKRAEKKAGEDLMHNFSSKSVGQDRLTIRPGLGIFKNGRASSPNRRRGVPDLAFSEMEFLHRSRDNAAVEDNPLPNPRGIEQRKRLREREEISAFFKPTKTPFKQDHGDNKNRRSTNSTDYAFSPRNEYGSKVDYLANRGGMSAQSTCLQEKSYEGSENPRSHPDVLSLHREESSPWIDLDIYPNTMSRRSHTTTYVTWSETQVSPASEGYDDHDRQNASPTPDFVRTCIKNTGIFNDTGISPYPHHHHQAFAEDGYFEQRDLSSAAHTKNDDFETNRRAAVLTTAEEISSGLLKSVKPAHTRSVPNSFGMISHSPPDPKTGDNRRPIDSGKLEVMQVKQQQPMTQDIRGRLTTELHDRNEIWDQHHERNPQNLPRPLAKKGEIREFRSTPISREEIAKGARIKRPSTVLPICKENDPSRRRDSLADGRFEKIESVQVSSANAEPDTHGSTELADQNTVYALGRQAEDIPQPNIERANSVPLSRTEDPARKDGPNSSLSNCGDFAQTVLASAHSLPMRGLRETDAQELPAWTPRWSPSLDMQINSIYAHQLQSQDVQHEGDDQFALNFTTVPSHGKFGALDVPYVQDIDLHIQEEFQHTSAIDDLEPQFGTPWSDNERGVIFLDDNEYGAGDLIPAQGFLKHELGDHEIWNASDQNEYGQDRGFEGYSAQESVHAYDTLSARHEYNEEGPEEETSMQGFWQPRRQY